MSANKKSFSLGYTIFASLLALVLGVAIGLIAPLYIMQAHFTQNITTDELILSHSHSGDSSVSHADIDVSVADVTVHFIELGNKYTGDCTLIKCGDTELLIDCGSKASSISTVKSYLDSYVTDGVIEYIIVTHAHQDHYAGFATGVSESSIFDLYNVGTGTTIIKFARTNQNQDGKLYKNFCREVNECITRGANVLTADNCYNQSTHIGSTFELSSNTSFEILYNPYYYANASTENDYSVCCMINSGEHKFLFTGDLEKGGEEALASQYRLDKGLGDNGYVEVDLYKAGHHGSKTSSNTKFLEVFRPHICCVCCCAGSSEYTKTATNQFPTQDFIDRISVYTTEVYVTTMCIDYDKGTFTSFNGNIVVGLISGNIIVKCSNNDIVLKDSTWFAERVQKGERSRPPSWT